MKARTTTRILIACCLCFLLVGFYSVSENSPENIGFYRANIDETGLIELTIDRLRKANFDLKTESIVVEDEHAKYQGKLSGQDIEITFEKKRNQWRPVESGEIFVRSLSKNSNEQANFKLEKASFEIYNENNSDTDQTLIKRKASSEHNIDKVTKTVTLDKLDRRLFQKPYSGVLFSSVSQLNDAPFLSARYVQLITDPAWNRVVYGDYDGWIKAYGNQGPGAEELNRPHGIDRDAFGNIYIADTGNNRVVILRLEGIGDQIELKYRFAFGSEQLAHPYDVAWDDHGTPFDVSDDIIWVADTENHRVLGFKVDGEEARVQYGYGTQGKAVGQFFEPKTIAVGRFNGLSDGTLFVGDTGNRRIIKLSKLTNDFEWLGEFSLKSESQLTSLDTDHWGNVYATDRSYEEILKLSADLEPIVTVGRKEDSIVHPVNFHITYGQFNIQAENKRYWAGFDQAFSLEKWSEHSGAERFQLGIDLQDFRVKLSQELNKMAINTKLTDHGKVTLNLIHNKTNANIRQIPFGWMTPGDKEFVWDRRDDLGWQVEPGHYQLQLSAESSYGNLTVIKETKPFYLPLYYWQDSGSSPYNDTYLIQGTRSSEWGHEPHETVATHPSEVIYRFTKLDATSDYEIRAEFYNKVGAYLKQNIAVDGTVIMPDLELQQGRNEVDWLVLPRETFTDGKIEISITKIAGEGDATISQLWLREANYDPNKQPGNIETSETVPENYVLLQNYPNPFNPTTTIEFGVPGEGLQQVTLKIFNVLGQTVAELVNTELPPGRHSVIWNGRDGFGNQVSSGVYYYRLDAGTFTGIKKLVLMK